MEAFLILKLSFWLSISIDFLFLFFGIYALLSFFIKRNFFVLVFSNGAGTRRTGRGRERVFKIGTRYGAGAGAVLVNLAAGRGLVLQNSPQTCPVAIPC